MNLLNIRDDDRQIVIVDGQIYVFDSARNEIWPMPESEIEPAPSPWRAMADGMARAIL